MKGYKDKKRLIAKSKLHVEKNQSLQEPCERAPTWTWPNVALEHAIDAMKIKENNNNKPLELVQVNQKGPGREQANAEGSGLGLVGVFKLTQGVFPWYPTDIYLNNVQIHSQASSARVQWVGRW